MATLAERPEEEQKRLLIAYERVSDRHQDIARQAVQRERAHADHPDRELVVIQDDGVSAYKTSIFDRPGGRELCDLIAAGRIEAVYADAQDRLSRGDELEWVTFRTLCESKGTKIVIDGRELGTDLGGRMEGILKALLARQESVERGHRVRSSAPARVRRRKLPYGGGRKMYGRDRAYNLIPSEVEIIRHKIVPKILACESELQIAKKLNAEGVPGPCGGRWHPASIGRMLRRPHLAGVVHVPGTDEVIDGEMAPILNRETWVRLQAHLAARDSGPERRGRDPVSPFLLMEPIEFICGGCGGHMVPRSGKVRKDGTRRFGYYCATRKRDGVDVCPRTPIDRDAIDSTVFAWVERHLDVEATQRAVEEASGAVVADARGSLREAERAEMQRQADMEKVERDYLGDRLSADAYEWLTAKLAGEREAAASETARLRGRVEQLEAGDSLADAEQRVLTYIAAVRATMRDLRAAPPNAATEHVAAVRAALAQIVATVIVGDLAHDRCITYAVFTPENVRGENVTAAVQAMMTGAGTTYLEIVPRPEVATLRTVSHEGQDYPVADGGSAPLPLADNDAFTSQKTSRRPRRRIRSSSLPPIHTFVPRRR